MSKKRSAYESLIDRVVIEDSYDKNFSESMWKKVDKNFNKLLKEFNLNVN